MFLTYWYFLIHNETWNAIFTSQVKILDDTDDREFHGGSDDDTVQAKPIQVAKCFTCF